MRNYTQDSTTLIDEVINAVKLTGVRALSELVFTIIQQTSAEWNKPTVLAEVMVRVIPKVMDTQDDSFNLTKTYELQADISDTGAVKKYTINYPRATTLDILEEQLQHLQNLLRPVVPVTAVSDTIMPTVDWKAIAEELVRTLGDTEDGKTTFTCVTCPVKDSCQRQALADPCFEHIMRHYSDRYTIKYAGKPEVDWPTAVEELLILNADVDGAMLCDRCAKALDGDRCTCVDTLREYLVNKHTK
ncbi:MAG: hypothetical protein WC261_08295 [Synergistaceae bacterium]